MYSNNITEYKGGKMSINPETLVANFLLDTREEYLYWEDDKSHSLQIVILKV